MQKIGFFGGSFNPVTNAHIKLARMAMETYALDQVIFVPMGDCYPKETLVKANHRYEMLKIATAQYENMQVSDLELVLTRSVTILEAFQIIEKTYQEIEAYFMMGSDNLEKLLRSSDCEALVKNYHYIVFERDTLTKEMMDSHPILQRFKQHFYLITKTKQESISASKVREHVKTGKMPNDMLPEGIYEYIQKHQLYKKEK